MGADVVIAPDMMKIKQRGLDIGVDILPYEDYIKTFIYKQGKLEQKKQKQKEK